MPGRARGVGARWAPVAGALLGVAASVWLFVAMHSGHAGRKLCESEGTRGPGTVSWWPPGTRCEGGLPIIRWTQFNYWWVFAAIALVTVGVLAGRAVDDWRWRRRSAKAAGGGLSSAN